MIHIAAARQSDPHLTNQSLNQKLSNPSWTLPSRPPWPVTVRLSVIPVGGEKITAQLAAAILMEIFNDWERVQPIYQRFMDCFVAKLPRNTNWAVDGSDLMAMALAIEVEKNDRPAEVIKESSAATKQSTQRCRQGQGGSGHNPGESRRKEENAPFLRAGSQARQMLAFVSMDALEDFYPPRLPRARRRKLAIIHALIAANSHESG